ncbi:MAG: hypothetical protein E2O39_12635 [Planctomycetota bacterium]|nr:MAG: hypothetical protein E2O39_12635 [Planctomycetota bacterium]
MRTLLSRFCEEFDSVVRPVLEPLDRLSKKLGEASQQVLDLQLLPHLRDARMHIETLADKVREQQAYVIIFGPLKSGKSTLMNAVSAAYVSEVTSLPAYPCMVYVSHSETPEFVVRRFNGRIDRPADPASLHMLVNRAHKELADRLREVETKGEDFDPARHLPEAVQRIDVKLPAGHLDSSGAVLVDTPGLYSRMKFGYDRMTREFRNSAACAIFVVKSDNLFLEQVFEEFNQLLELFSRIFLVVNLDTSKVDLKADGSLEPSLESSDPLRLIEAFENLAMSAPLKEAAEEGRLRIYPVDLLRAASERLKGGESHTETMAGHEGQASFDGFLDDLTEYLNSTEYLVAFLGDSLRQATTFLTEVGDLCGAEASTRLRERVRELQAREEKEKARLQAVKRLASHDWVADFQGMEAGLDTPILEHARGADESSAESMRAAFDEWFGSNASLQSLLGESLIPVLKESRKQVAGFVRQTLEERVATGQAGILVPAGIGRDLTTSGIHLAELGEKAMAAVADDPGREPIDLPLRGSEIPVRKRLVDWLLFRSRATVCRRLFGPDNRPNFPLPKQLKAKRLGGGVRQAMLESLETFRARFGTETLDRSRARIVREYVDAVTSALRFRFEAEEELLGEALTELRGELKESLDVLAHLNAAQTASAQALREIAELSESYGETDPALLSKPTEDRILLEDVILTPAKPGAGHVAVEPTAVEPASSEIAPETD